MRLGVLGGAFNPPHVGHLVCAQEALARLELSEVALVPTGQAPHRAIEDDPGAEVRVELCARAVAGDPRFAVSRIEVDRPGPSYTVDTLRSLADSDPVLVLGGDQAASLPSWREPEEVLRLATVAVAGRSGFEHERVQGAVGSLPGAERLVYFDMPRIDVSSTLVRRRAAAGEPIRYLVPDAVADYIEANGLYGASAPVSAS